MVADTKLNKPSKLRNGTYLREPDGARSLYYSPYSFEDAATNFKLSVVYDDGWHVVSDDDEQAQLLSIAYILPGEYVHVYGGRVTSYL